MTGLADPSQPIDGKNSHAPGARHAIGTGRASHGRQFFELLPMLDIDGSILIKLFTDGGHAEIGRGLAEEVGNTGYADMLSGADGY